MNKIKEERFDEERALYGSQGLEIQHCQFDGPADGESALKECKEIKVSDSFFNLRYPFWHDEDLTIQGCELTPNCRAALWYSKKVKIFDTKLHGIKALRECKEVEMEGCHVISPEFGWSVDDLSMKDTEVESEYFMLRSNRLHFDQVTLKGKYSFQYITDSVFENCDFNTKDAFWHAKNVTVKNSTIRGEYLAWYCESVTFENCTMIGTQPLCYCKGLKLINCEMLEADLAFEKSEVEATLTQPMISIKNPRSGSIRLPGLGELIMDDDGAEGKVIVE